MAGKKCNSPTRWERAALREEFRKEGSIHGESNRSFPSLSPGLNATALRLKGMRTERRSLRLQLLALGACMAGFLAFVWLGVQNRDVLLAKPERWGLLPAVGIMGMSACACLPVLLGKKKGMDRYEEEN